MSAAAGEGQLHCALGLGDVVLYFVTACTGMQWVAFAAAAGPASLGLWVVAALTMFMPLSVCTVALAARHPDEGGLYVWVKRAFGPFAGFLAGWTYWTSNLPYLGGMLYFAAGNVLWAWVGVQGASPLWFISFALFGLGFGTLLNIFGLSVSKYLTNAAAFAQCATLVLLVTVGLTTMLHDGPASPFTAAALRPPQGIGAWMLLSTLVFAMAGPESASFMGGEIRDPRRTVPRALARAAPIVLLIYIGGTLAVLVAVPWQETSGMYGIMQAVDRAGARYSASWVTPLTAGLIVITCLGSATAWVASVARIPFVVGVDNYLPKAFGRLHPKYGTPVTALLVQVAITMVFAVTGQAGTSVKGAYDVLVSLMVIAEMFPYMLLFSATIRLLWCESPGSNVRSRAQRGAVIGTAVLGLVTTFGAIGFATLPKPDEPHPGLAVAKIVGMTGGMIGIGIGLYWRGAKRARRPERVAEGP